MGPRVKDLERLVREGRVDGLDLGDVLRLRGADERVQALKWAVTLFKALPAEYVRGAGGEGQCLAAAYREVRFDDHPEEFPDEIRRECFNSKQAAATDLERKMIYASGSDDVPGAFKSLYWYKCCLRGDVQRTRDHVF